LLGNPGNHLHQEFTLHTFYGNPEISVPNPYAVRQEAFLDFVGAPGLETEVPSVPEDWQSGLNFRHGDRELFYVNANGLF
jgi:hypothetical protein